MMTDCKQHTYGPSGYIQWFEWAEEKAKTHEQQQCEECGLWLIWVRR